MLGRALVVALCLSLPLSAAQDPLDLARGLRDIGQPDLALDYLDDVAKKNPPADVKVILPLERAKCLLAIAQLESEEGAREGGVAQANAAFQTFVDANPKHPRLPEAKLAQAQVKAVQAVSQLVRTRKITDPNPAEARKKRNAAIKDTQPLFRKASELFDEAAKGLAALEKSTTDENRKRELHKTILQAELDSAINKYKLVDTYPSDVQGEDVKKRGDTLDEARKLFIALGRKDETSPVCWQARAWAGMCEHDKSDRAAGDKIFAQVKKDGVKTAAGADGVRMVEFFETLLQYLAAVNDPNPKSVGLARADARRWLDKDRYRPRMTPQRLSMTFYYAYLTEMLGQSEIQWEKQPKADVDAKKPLVMKSVSSQGVSYLKEAAREYKRLLEFDNEYTERAADNRNRATRYIVGNTPKEPKFYVDLEETQMAGMVQLMKANDARAEADQIDDSDKPKLEAARKKEKAEFAKAIALMERAKQLLDANTPPREVAETKFNHAIAFYTAEQYPLAAVAGESLARTGRGAIAAKGGFLGVDSYLRARDRQDEDADESSKASDRDRAIALGIFLDKAFPADPSTDSARLRIGQVLAVEKHYQASFDMLGRISPGFADVATARDIQGRVAFMLIASKESTLSDEQKAVVFKKAVADCEAVKAPAGGTGLKAYFTVRTLLANLHLSDRPRGFPVAEKIAVENLKLIAASTLDAADKKTLSFSSDEARLRAIFGQVGKQFQDGKYKEMADRLAPVLAEMNTQGPARVDGVVGEAGDAAVKLDNFRREVVLLAMQGRIREGEFDKAAGLFELLDRLGGSIDDTTAALNRLVALVRPQVEALRTAKKDPEADKLSNTIGDLLAKQAAKDKQPLRVQASLGRSLRNLGQNDKAIEVLKKIPAPPMEKLLMKSSEHREVELRDSIVAYQIAVLELARAYRGTRNFAEADKVLKTALGDDKVKGWAKSLDYKKEVVLVQEDRAATMPAGTDAEKGARAKAWLEAKKGWQTLSSQYEGAIRNKEIPAEDREKLKPVWLDLGCDLRRCIARANSQIITDPAKLTTSLATMGGGLIELETANATAITPEIKEKYRDLLNDYPPMKEEYKKRGGKAFLEENTGN